MFQLSTTVLKSVDLGYVQQMKLISEMDLSQYAHGQTKKTHTNIHTYIYRHTHVHTQICIYVYRHTHVHTYAQIPRRQ